MDLSKKEIHLIFNCIEYCYNDLCSYINDSDVNIILKNEGILVFSALECLLDKFEKVIKE